MDAMLRQSYLLCLLCLPERDTVLVSVCISALPLEYGERQRRRQPHPHAMLYAQMGSTGRARRGLSWMSRELAERWPAQDGWRNVPVRDGRAFRRMMHTAVDRYAVLEAKKAIQHVDLSEYSNRQRLVLPRFGAGRGAALTERS